MCLVLLDVETRERDFLFDITPDVNIVTHSGMTTAGSSLTGFVHAHAGDKVHAVQNKSIDHAANHLISTQLVANQHPTPSPQYNGCGHGRGRNTGGNKPQFQLCGKIGHLVQRCFQRFNINWSN